MRGLSNPLMSSAASISSKWATFSQSSVVSASACSSRGLCFHCELPKCIMAAVDLYILSFSTYYFEKKFLFFVSLSINKNLCKAKYVKSLISNTHLFSIINSINCNHTLSYKLILFWIALDKA
jgi:hypothetical protein